MDELENLNVTVSDDDVAPPFCNPLCLLHAANNALESCGRQLNSGWLICFFRILRTHNGTLVEALRLVDECVERKRFYIRKEIVWTELRGKKRVKVVPQMISPDSTSTDREDAKKFVAPPLFSKLLMGVMKVSFDFRAHAVVTLPVGAVGL